MSAFRHADLVSLWDRPPEFLPRRPPSSTHRWRYTTVRDELFRVADDLDKGASERRVALLADPTLADAAATDGLHAGIQLLLSGESAAPHRHSPSALRIGLEGTGIVTTVDDDDLPLGTTRRGTEPLRYLARPRRAERPGRSLAGRGRSATGFSGGRRVVRAQPLRAGRHPSGPAVGSTNGSIRVGGGSKPSCNRSPAEGGVRSLELGAGSVMPTMAVTVHAVESGATLRLPARTAGTIVLIGRGRFTVDGGDVSRYDVISLRSWTSSSFCSATDDAVVFVVDTLARSAGARSVPRARRSRSPREGAQRRWEPDDRSCRDPAADRSVAGPPR